MENTKLGITLNKIDGWIYIKICHTVHHEDSKKFYSSSYYRIVKSLIGFPCEITEEQYLSTVKNHYILKSSLIKNKLDDFVRSDREKEFVPFSVNE